MIVSSTTAKFKPLAYLVVGVAVSNVANILILIILHDVCFLPKNYGASAENALQMAAKDGGHENVIGDRGIHWRGVRGRGM